LIFATVEKKPTRYSHSLTQRIDYMTTLIGRLHELNDRFDG
jgi:hypothetical protein